MCGQWSTGKGGRTLKWKTKASFKGIQNDTDLLRTERSGQGVGQGCAGEANETDDDQPCEQENLFNSIFRLELGCMRLSNMSG